MLRYFNFEPSFKLRWCRAQDLFGPQIPVTTGGFELRISCIRITGLQGKGVSISLTPLYHIHPLHRHLGISWAVTARAHLCTYVAAGLDLRTFVFRAQAANH